MNRKEKVYLVILLYMVMMQPQVEEVWVEILGYIFFVIVSIFFTLEGFE